MVRHRNIKTLFLIFFAHILDKAAKVGAWIDLAHHSIYAKKGPVSLSSIVLQMIESIFLKIITICWPITLTGTQLSIIV